MDARVRKHQTLSDDVFTGLSAGGTATIAARSGDLALVVDKQGVVLDTAADGDTELLQTAARWTRKALLDCVTVESRPKIDALLRTTQKGSPSRWRQVNHPLDSGLDLPISYRAFALHSDGPLLLVGRDLRPMAEMQQNLIDLQHSMERDYARRFQTEARYRLLFRMTSEAVLIIDANDLTVAEANPAAAELLSLPTGKLHGRPLKSLFADSDFAAISEHLAQVKSLGKGELDGVHGAAGTGLNLATSLLRQDNGVLYLIHAHSSERVSAPGSASGASPVLDVLELSPDGFVVTDMDGRILSANDAFLEMCQLATDMQVHNQPLDNWLGRQGVDLNVLRKNLRQRGSVRQYVTTIKTEYGASVDVELSAVAAPDADVPSLGFVIRRTLKTVDTARDYASQPLSQSLEQMTDLVGRVPLKDLVRETTDLIERMCIEAALKLTTNNRASAADMLGLSRQSLYVKLRRYGIGDPESLPEDNH
ncbi:MAG: transcriptional regulator PpsR [Pseudomonadota bacterium]